MEENNALRGDAVRETVRLALAALGNLEPLIYDAGGICKLCNPVGSPRPVLPLAHRVQTGGQCPGSAFEYARSRLATLTREG